MPDSMDNCPHDTSSGLRRRVTAAAVAAAGGRLTDRDRRILALLDEHFTFTTSQLALLAGFGSVITAQHRLAALHARGVLHRDRPFHQQPVPPGRGSHEPSRRPARPRSRPPHPARPSHPRPVRLYGPSGVGHFAGPPAEQKLYSRLRDAEDARRLWTVTEELTGVRFPATETTASA